MAEENKNVQYLEHNGRRIDRNKYLESLYEDRNKYEQELKEAGYGPKKRKQALAEYDRGIELIKSGKMSISNDGLYISSDNDWVNAKEGRDYTGMATGRFKKAFDDSASAQQKYESDGFGKHFINTVFGGNAPTEDQWASAWVNRDQLGTDNNRNRTSRYSALADMIDSYKNAHLNDNFEGTAFSSAEDFNNRLSNLSTKLRDGSVNDDDIRAAASAGIDLEGYMKDTADVTKTKAEQEAFNKDYTAEKIKARKLELIQQGYSQEDADKLIQAEQANEQNKRQKTLDDLELQNRKALQDQEWAQFVNEHYNGVGYTPMLYDIGHANYSKNKYEAYMANHNFTPENNIKTWLSNIPKYKQWLANGLIYMANNGSNKLVDLGNNDYLLKDSVDFNTGTAYVFNKDTRQLRTIRPNESLKLQQALENKWRNEHPLSSNNIQWGKQGLKFQQGGQIPTQEQILTALQSGQIDTQTAQQYLAQLEQLSQTQQIPTTSSQTDIWGDPITATSGLKTPAQLKKELQQNRLKALKDRADKNGRSVEAQKFGEAKAKDSDWGTAEWIRFGNLINDISSIGSSYVPVYGTAIAGVQGLGSMAADLWADAIDDKVSSGDMWSNLSTNAAIAGLGMIPGGASKIGKVWKTAKKLIPAALSAYGGYEQFSDPNVRKSFKKLISSGKENELTNDDWKNIMNGMKMIAFTHNTGKAASQAFNGTLRNSKVPGTSVLRKFGELSIGNKDARIANQKLIRLQSLRDIDTGTKEYTIEINGKKLTGSKENLQKLINASKKSGTSEERLNRFNTVFDELATSGKIKAEGFKTTTKTGGENITLDLEVLKALSSGDDAAYLTALEGAIKNGSKVKTSHGEHVLTDTESKALLDAFKNKKGTREENLKALEEAWNTFGKKTPEVETSKYLSGLSESDFADHSGWFAKRNPFGNSIESISSLEKIESAKPSRLEGNSNTAQLNRLRYLRQSEIEKQARANSSTLNALGKVFSNNWQMANGAGPFKTRQQRLEGLQAERGVKDYNDNLIGANQSVKDLHNEAVQWSTTPEGQSALNGRRLTPKELIEYYQNNIKAPKERLNNIVSELNIAEKDVDLYAKIAKRKYKTEIGHMSDAEALEWIKTNGKEGEISKAVTSANRNQRYANKRVEQFQQWKRGEGRNVPKNEQAKEYAKYKQRIKRENINTKEKADNDAFIASFVPRDPSSKHLKFKDTETAIKEILEVDSSLERFTNKEILRRFNSDATLQTLVEQNIARKTVSVTPTPPSGGSPIPTPKPTHTTTDTASLLREFDDPTGLKNFDSWIDKQINDNGYSIADLRSLLQDRTFRARELGVYKKGGNLNKLQELRNFTHTTNIIKAASGVKFSNGTGANWHDEIFSTYRQNILDKLSQFGNDDTYGNNLNNMQHRHSNLYNSANVSGNWQDTAYSSSDVKDYQNDYDNFDSHGYNSGQYGAISKAQSNGRYSVNGKRTSGDWGSTGYKNDGLYSAITDDRRLLGRKGDWDENSDTYKQWQKDLNDRGWETYLDTSDNYYKLRRLNSNNPNQSSNSNTSLQGAYGRNIDPTLYANILKDLKSGKYNILGNKLFNASLPFRQYIDTKRVNEENLRLGKVLPFLKQTPEQNLRQVGDYQSKVKGAQVNADLRNLFTPGSDNAANTLGMLAIYKHGQDANDKYDAIDNNMVRTTGDKVTEAKWKDTVNRTEDSNDNMKAMLSARQSNRLLEAQKNLQDLHNKLIFRQDIAQMWNTQLAKERNYKLKELALSPGLESSEEYQKLYSDYLSENDDVKATKIYNKIKDMQRAFQLKQLRENKDLYLAKKGMKIKSSAEVALEDKKQFLKAIKDSNNDNTKRQLHLSKSIQKFIEKALQY